MVMVKENCDVEISQPAKHVSCFLTGTKHDHMSNYKSKVLFNLTPAKREKEGSPQCGHEGFFLLLQKLVLLLQVADLGIFQQTLQLSLNLPLDISPWEDKDKENEHGCERCI